MRVINIQAAKTHLSRLVEDAVLGEDIILGKAGKPMVRLVPYVVAPKSARQGGQFRGQILETPDCWEPGDDPLGESAAGPLYNHIRMPDLMAERPPGA